MDELKNNLYRENKLPAMRPIYLSRSGKLFIKCTLYI